MWPDADFGALRVGVISVDVEEVIGKAVSGGQGKFADGDSAGGFDVDADAILDQPAGGGQEAVDVGAGTVFRLAVAGMVMGGSQRTSQHSAACGLTGGVITDTPAHRRCAQIIRSEVAAPSYQETT